MFDINNNLTVTVSKLPVPVICPGVHLIDGKIFVFGGVEPDVDWYDYPYDYHNEIQVFTPEHNLTYCIYSGIDTVFISPGKDSILIEAQFNNDLESDFAPFAVFTGLYGLERDSIYLYDDGNHGDGLANDKMFGNHYATDSEDEYVVNISALRMDNRTYLKRYDLQRFTSKDP